MTWVKINDTMPEDPRWESDKCGPIGLALHLAGLAYCARQLTDGHIPAGMPRRLLDIEDSGEVINALIAHGWWKQSDNVGYEIVDYLTDQPSAERVREQQTLRAERQKRWLDKKRDASQDASRDAAPAPPRPAPKGSGKGGVVAGAGSAGADPLAPPPLSRPLTPTLAGLPIGVIPTITVRGLDGKEI